MNRRWTHTRARVPLSVVALSCALQAACGADDKDGAGGDDGGDGPLYVVHSTIDTDDVRVGYLVTTPSIEGDVEVDVTKGIEVPGGGYLYGPPGGKYVLLGGSESPTFTRYELDDKGKLKQGATVS